MSKTKELTQENQLKVDKLLKRVNFTSNIMNSLSAKEDAEFTQKDINTFFKLQESYQNILAELYRVAFELKSPEVNRAIKSDHKKVITAVDELYTKIDELFANNIPTIVAKKDQGMIHKTLKSQHLTLKEATKIEDSLNKLALYIKNPNSVAAVNKEIDAPSVTFYTHELARIGTKVSRHLSKFREKEAAKVLYIKNNQKVFLSEVKKTIGNKITNKKHSKYMLSYVKAKQDLSNNYGIKQNQPIDEDTFNHIKMKITQSADNIIKDFAKRNIEPTSIMQKKISGTQDLTLEHHPIELSVCANFHNFFNKILLGDKYKEITQFDNIEHLAKSNKIIKDSVKYCYWQDREKAYSITCNAILINTVDHCLSLKEKGVDIKIVGEFADDQAPDLIAGNEPTL